MELSLQIRVASAVAMVEFGRARQLTLKSLLALRPETAFRWRDVVKSDKAADLQVICM
jgi:hypothetical protein